MSLICLLYLRLVHATFHYGTKKVHFSNTFDLLHADDSQNCVVICHFRVCVNSWKNELSKYVKWIVYTITRVAISKCTHEQWYNKEIYYYLLYYLAQFDNWCFNFWNSNFVKFNFCEQTYQIFDLLVLSSLSRAWITSTVDERIWGWVLKVSLVSLGSWKILNFFLIFNHFL